MKPPNEYTNQELGYLLGNAAKNIDYRWRQGIKEDDYDRQLVLDPGYFVMLLKEAADRLKVS